MNPRWTRATLIVLAVLLVLGNVVSVTGSGLGCPDWPLCHGRLIPPMRVDAWIEYLHRLAGLVTSLLILGTAWMAHRSGVALYRTLAWTAVGLLVLQVPLGALVVLLELPPAVVPVHLGLAFVLFGVLTLLHLSVRTGTERLRIRSWLAGVLAGLLVVQAVMGALVRHFHASLVCPEFPTCLAGRWIPPLQDPRFHIHLTHRFVAYALVLVALLLLRRGIRRDAGILLTLFLLQIGLGAWTVWSGVHLFVVSLHYANALMLLFWALHMTVTTPPGTRSVHPPSPDMPPL